MPWVALALTVSACGGPLPPPFKPVADVKELMQAVVDPSADVVWESVAIIFTKDHVEERRPRTKEEWAANRRVRFVIKQVEAELTEFKPLGN